jgi:2-hydroxy-3-oxopropionate reductase
MSSIGFIGLGIMGKPMALNLIQGGHKLFLYSRSGVPQELTAAGGSACDSAKAVAQQADIVIVMVPDTPDVEKVLFGANGVAEGLSKGKLVIDMSSISPLATKDYARCVNELGCDYLDAPVSGGEVGAKNAALTIMVGGPRGAFDRAQPIFELMGKNITLVGGNGDGQTCKVANQIIVALNIAAMSEAMVLATRAGVDPQQVFEAIRGGLAGSTVLEAKMPLVLQGNFKPGFRIELHIKDLMSAMDTAHELHVPLPLSSAVLEILQALRVDGKGRDDHGGIIQFYEKMARVEVRSS